MRCSLLVVTGLLLASPTVARDYSMSGTWLDQMIRTPLEVGETQTDAKLVESVGVGALAITLEATPVAEVASALGGTVRRSGEAGEAMEWLCFTDKVAALWFYSDGEMGQGLVMGVALEEGISPPDEAGCTLIDILPPVTFGTPLTGQTRGEVQAVLGKTVADPQGWFAYESITPSPLGGSFQTRQTLAYAEGAGGNVTSVVILQQSGD